MLADDRAHDLNVRIRAGAALLLLVVPLAACRASAQVAVAITNKGSGVITVTLALDPAAATRIGDVRAALRTADLQHAGWVLDPPQPDAASIHHTFANVSEANALLATLGPAQLHVHRHRSLLTTKLSADGSVDLRNGLDAFADPSVAKALGADSMSQFVARYESGGGTLPDLSTLISVSLPATPGHVGTGTVHGHTVTWTVPLGQQLAIGASASATDFVALFWFALALAALVAFLVLTSRILRQRADQAHHDRFTLSRPTSLS